MPQKLLNLSLIAGIVVGAFMVWTTGRQRDRLEQRYRLLAQTAGEMLVTDPTRPLFLALNTGEPLHYAWRVYLPPNFRQNIRDRFGSTSSSISSSSTEMIARVRFKVNALGGLDHYASFAGGSSRSTIAPKSLVDFMKGRWDEFQVEQVGKDGATIDPTKSTVLLRLTFPPGLQDEFKKLFPLYEQSRFLPVFYEITLDPSAP